jgi:hypothetical protein
VQEISSGQFQAVELNGLAAWEEFEDLESMLVFMLEAALGRA